jgi:hypothetical protein
LPSLVAQVRYDHLLPGLLSADNYPAGQQVGAQTALARAFIDDPSFEELVQATIGKFSAGYGICRAQVMTTAQLDALADRQPGPATCSAFTCCS